MNPDKQIWNQLQTEILMNNADLMKEKEDIEERIREFQVNEKQQVKMEENEITDVVDVKQAKKQIYDGIECEDSLFIFPKSNILRMILYRIVTHT